MSDNPLDPDPQRTARIEARARQLWEEDGSPKVDLATYRERAEFLVGVEDSAGAAQLPHPDSDEGRRLEAMVEEAAIQENLGEFPERSTDEGDVRHTPMTREELREREHVEHEAIPGSDAPSSPGGSEDRI